MTNPELSNERITGSRISNPESRTAAVAGGVWVNPNPKLTDKRGGYVNWRGEPIQVTHRGAGAPRWVDWPLTTNMAVRRNAFLDVGGFSPVYGIYDEDVDFGLKIRRAGYRIAFAPEAAVYHYFLKRPRQPPTKAAAFRDGRNRAILLVRNYGRSARLPLFLLTAPWIRGWEALCASALCCLKQAGHYAAYLAGIAAGLVVGARNQAERDRRP
jgi:GT2 family glycosyltransferase